MSNGDIGWGLVVGIGGTIYGCVLLARGVSAYSLAQTVLGLALIVLDGTWLRARRRNRGGDRTTE